MHSWGFITVAAGVVLFALLSRRMQSTILTAPMIFAAFGLAIGPAGLSLADFDFGHGFVHGLAEVTLILVLFSDAARIDLRQVRRDHNLPLRMLLIGLPLIVVAGTLVGLALPLGLSLWEAALLAAILAPTDAALGQSVVSSPLVPARIRQALNIESGLNDGIALPLVLLLACFAGASQADPGQNWLLFGALQVTLGPLAGLVIGGAGAWLIDRAVKAGWMEESYEGPAVLALALLAFAGAEAIGGNGFIAAFVAGLVFGNVVRDRCRFVFEFAEAEGQLLVLLTFLLFGAAILPEAIAHAGPWALVYALLSLTLVRLLPIAVSLLGSGVSGATVVFLGWFGPRGLASILFALLVLESAEIPIAEELVVITVITVALSILAHGLSAAPAARRYGALAAAKKDGAESRAVSELPTRHGMVSPSD